MKGTKKILRRCFEILVLVKGKLTKIVILCLRWLLLLKYINWVVFQLNKAAPCINLHVCIYSHQIFSTKTWTNKFPENMNPEKIDRERLAM